MYVSSWSSRSRRLSISFNCTFRDLASLRAVYCPPGIRPQGFIVVSDAVGGRIGQGVVKRDKGIVNFVQEQVVGQLVKGRLGINGFLLILFIGLGTFLGSGFLCQRSGCLRTRRRTHPAVRQITRSRDKRYCKNMVFRCLILNKSSIGVSVLFCITTLYSI